MAEQILAAVASIGVKGWVEIIVALTIPVSFCVIMHQRIKSNRSIGTRIIQFAAVCMLVPAITVLALEDILDGATVGTLIGGLVGYLLSGIAEYDRTKSQDS